MHLSIEYSQQKAGSGYSCSHFTDGKAKSEKLCDRPKGRGLGCGGASVSPASPLHTQLRVLLPGWRVGDMHSWSSGSAWLCAGGSVLGTVKRDDPDQTPHRRRGSNSPTWICSSQVVLDGKLLPRTEPQDPPQGPPKGQVVSHSGPPALRTKGPSVV